MKEFYENMRPSRTSDNISCMIRGKQIIITKPIIRTILELGKCENQIFLHKTIPFLKDMIPISTCRVMGKNKF